MSIEFMNRVWKTSNLKGSQRLLLLAIADNADDEGFAWPGVNYLAKKVNCTRQYIVKMTAELEETGELFVNHRKEAGANNQYIILLGQDAQTLRDVMVKKMRLSEKEAEKLVKQTLEGVNHSLHPTKVGCKPQFTGGVNHSLHEPPITINYIYMDRLLEKIHPVQANGREADYLGQVVAAAKGGVPAVEDPYPADPFWGHRDNFLKIWERKTHAYPNEDEKDVIAKLGQEEGADPAAWDLALTACNLNWTGRGRWTVARAVEVYRDGGDYQKTMERLFPDKKGAKTNGNGRQNGAKRGGVTQEELRKRQAAIQKRLDRANGRAG